MRRKGLKQEKPIKLTGAGKRHEEHHVRENRLPRE
jgi:hypothetical protein